MVFTTALVQLLVGDDKLSNLKHAEDKIKEAAENGAVLIILPESFNTPFGNKKLLSEFAEEIPHGETSKTLSYSAKKYEIYIIVVHKESQSSIKSIHINTPRLATGGSYPEVDDGIYYNTCTVWSPKGLMIGKYRKLHLFDVDIPNGMTFKESLIFSPGHSLLTFTIDKNCKITNETHRNDEECTVGIGICYDLRFDELAKIYRHKGCNMLVYPAAFNMTTGPLHWELLQRSRAVDNQLYVCGVSPARNVEGYIVYGNSQFTDPWGKVLQQAGVDEEILYCTVDMTTCSNASFKQNVIVRRQIPIFEQRRSDIYETINKLDS